MVDAQTSGRTAEEVVEQAIAALKGTQPESVLPLLERAVRQWPRDARLWHLTGLVHRADERRELALPALRHAVELAPGEPLIAHALARTLLEAGLPSVAAYARALQLAPGTPEILKGLVSALLAERRMDEAIAGLGAALERSPLWADGHALLADVRWMRGERRGFARGFRAALKEHPGNLELRRVQIISLLHAEQYDEALASIAEGRRSAGDDPLFDANEAVVHSERGEVERAEALFARLAETEDSSVQVRRVRNLLRGGRPGDASAIIDRWIGTRQADLFWPYASAAWRMTGDPRWHWLEGDERLVGVLDIADRLPPLERLAETLRELHRTGGQPLAQSVRGGTQTDGNLFQRIDPIIVKLREAIRAAVADHGARLPQSDPAHPTLGRPRHPFRFSGAWSVRLSAGGHHANHVHPMGWLSSALYVVLPPRHDDSHAGWLALGEPDAQLKLGLAPVRMIEPLLGRLVLFPSTMWHGTRPFGSGERMTVAFDVAVPS